MATLQQVRSQTKQGQWASIFPNEQVTETQSTLFVKKLLAVAVSSISYLRALFPENAFGDRCLEDVNLKILRDDSNCPEACRVIQWIRGCFDALEKKYLRAVMIGIYEDPEDPDTVIEQYSFKFAYGDGAGVDIYRNGAKVTSAKSDKETKKATIRLLRTIVLLSQTLSPLPDDVMMTMKLLYYDEVTPEDYNPPGFKECDCDNFNFKEEPINIRVGDVATQYHAFKLRIKTLNHDLQDAKEDGETSVVPGETIQPDCEEIYETTSLYQENVEEELDKENIDPKTNIIIAEKEQNEEEQVHEENAQVPQFQVPDSVEAPSLVRSNTRVSTPASSIAPDEQSEEIVTKCPCGVYEDDGLMILCATCNTWQHATCFAILKPEEAPGVHYCVECCVQNTDNQCTDNVLSTIEDPKELKDMCLWRRALVAILDVTRILGPNLAKRLGITAAVGNRILKRLEVEGFVNSGGKAKRFGKLVQKEEILKRGYDKYFHSLEDEQDEEISMVTEKASNLQLHSKKTNEHEVNTSRSLKRKSGGEVVSAKNQDLRFEISNSQQSPMSQDFTAKKRRKTSVSVEAMCV